MTTLLQDTFTGVNGTLLTAHTMDVGGGWTTLAGAFAIQSNKAQQNAFGVASYAAADAGAADVTVSIDAVLPASGDVSAGLYLRASDVSNGWIVAYENDGVGLFFRIFERAAGVNTSRAAVTMTQTAGTHTISVTLSGSTITATSDGANMISYGSATSNQTATKFGLYQYKDGSFIACDVDNFLVTGAGGGGIHPYWLHAAQRVIGGPD